jgi:hypothetical protein
MQETPQQYIQRILGFIDGKDPLQVQRDTPKKLQKLIKPLSKKQLTQRPEPGKVVDRGNSRSPGRRRTGRRMAHASDPGQQRRIPAAF